MHINTSGIIYIYDSHPAGFARFTFLVFNDRENAERYLSSMWPYLDLGSGFDKLAAQIKLFDARLFQLKPKQTINVSRSCIISVGITQTCI